MKTKLINEQVKPELRLLTQEQIHAVHTYSLDILEHTGIKVESKTGRDIFAKSKSVIIEDETVFIKKELVEHAIKTAPSVVSIYNKSGEPAFSLGKDQNDTFFGIGVTNNYFQDIETNRLLPFTRKHTRHSVKLGDMLGNYDMVSTVGIPTDVDPEKLDLYNALDMYANTSKPLVLLTEGKRIDGVYELLTFLHGEITEKPFTLSYFNPITPLVLNEDTVTKMITAVKNGLPVIYSNYSMYGGSSPITEGGTLALLNAELLAGLVFSQLIKEGSSVILGSLPAAFNMVTMGSYYTPSSYLLNLACAEMMDFYEIPHCGTSGSGNGWGGDLLADGNFWMNHLTSVMGKVGCAPFVGGNFDSLAFSPTVVVLSDFIIGQVRKLVGGFLLNDDTVNLSEIHAVGHGGNYFTSEQTLMSLSELDMEASIWPQLTLDLWKEQGMPNAEKILIEYAKNLFEKAQKASEENSGIIEKGESYIHHKTK